MALNWNTCLVLPVYSHSTPITANIEVQHTDRGLCPSTRTNLHHHTHLSCLSFGATIFSTTRSRQSPCNRYGTRQNVRGASPPSPSNSSAIYSPMRLGKLLLFWLSPVIDCIHTRQRPDLLPPHFRFQYISSSLAAAGSSFIRSTRPGLTI